MYFQLDAFNNEPDLNKLIMLTTTETSTLLTQVILFKFNFRKLKKIVSEYKVYKLYFINID